MVPRAGPSLKSELRQQLELLGVGQASVRSGLGRPVADLVPEALELLGGREVVDVHGRDELAPVLQEGGQLALDARPDVLYVIGLVGLPQQEVRRPVWGLALLGEE